MAVPLLFAADIPIPVPGSGGPKPPGKDEEKPKDAEFKYSAWCAFRDLASIKPPPNKVDPKDERSRPGSENWEGVGRRGQWTTVVLEVKNTTEKSDYKGTAVINWNPMKLTDEGQLPFTTFYRQDFEVGPGTTKLYSFSILCPENAWTEPVRIDISANGRGYDPRYIQIHDLDSFKEDFVAVVSEKSGAFRHLAVKRKNMEDESRVRERRVAVVEPQELSARWHDLTLANLIILDNPSVEKISETQFEALKSYVQAGGQILIIAGAEPSRLRGPIEELAGIKVGQMAEIDGIDGGESNDVNLGLKAGSKLPIVDVTATPSDSMIVQRNHKSQHVEKTTRFFGPGSVTFLPYSLSDALLERWEGRSVIPVSIIERARGKSLFALKINDEDMPVQHNAWGQEVRQPQPDLTQLRDFRRSLDESFSKDTPVQMQKPDFVFVFLLFYLLFAVPGNYFIFGWFRRREIAWLAVPVWAASFSIIAYFVGYYGQTGQLTVSEVSVIEAGPGQNTGMARTFMGLYAPYRDDYQLEFRPIADPPPFETQAAPSHLLSVAHQSGTIETQELRVIDGGRLRVERLRVQQRSTRRLELTHRAQLGEGLDVKVRRDDSNALNVEIENKTGYTLYSPVMFYEGQEYDLGIGEGNALAPAQGNRVDNIVAGDSRRKTQKLFFATPIVLSSSRGNDATNRQTALRGYMKDQITKYNRCVVCAWIDNKDGSLPVLVAGSGEKPSKPKMEGQTLLVVPVTIKSSFQISSAIEQPKVKYSQDYNVTNNTGNWRDVSSKTIVPLQLDKGTQPNVVTVQNLATAAYLSVQLPSRYREMADAGLKLQLRFKIETAALGPKTPGTPQQGTDGTMFVQVRTNSNQWEELDSQVLTNVTTTPQTVEPVLLPMTNPNHMQNGVVSLRISFMANEAAVQTGKSVLTKLSGINCKVSRGGEKAEGD